MHPLAMHTRMLPRNGPLPFTTVLQRMVDAKADFNLANHKGETPLSCNLANASKETFSADGAVFKMLMELGVDVTPSKDREHPLVAVSKVRAHTHVALAPRSLWHLQVAHAHGRCMHAC